jgi:bifunctional non-homologous end joining protein LigD
MFRREWPYFLAFDVLSIDGEDLRALPLVQRKRQLTRIMPRVESRLMFLDAIPARGTPPVRARLRARSRGHRGEVVEGCLSV